MSNSQNSGSKNLLTTFEMVGIAYSAMVGVGILSLPYGLTKIAAQDAWIAAIIGVVYPLYMVLLAAFMSRKHPEEDILVLNKKYFGKVLGTISNTFFVFFYLFYITAVLSGMSNIIRIFIVSFLSPLKIFVVAAALMLYLSYQGLKAVGRVNEVLLYLSLGLSLIPITALKYGSILNISPVLGSGFGNIMKASLQSMYTYGCIEIIFLLYPYMKDTKKVKKAGMMTSALVCLVYSWLTFITIYYLGPDLVLKNNWPTIAVTQSVRIPIISTFRFIFMFLWTLSAFKTLSTLYYSAAYTLKRISNKIDMKAANYILYPLVIGIAFLYGDEVSRRDILDRIVPVFTYISIISISLLCFFIAIKSRSKKKA